MEHFYCTNVTSRLQQQNKHEEGFDGLYLNVNSGLICITTKETIRGFLMDCIHVYTPVYPRTNLIQCCFRLHKRVGASQN